MVALVSSEDPVGGQLESAPGCLCLSAGLCGVVHTASCCLLASFGIKAYVASHTAFCCCMCKRTLKLCVDNSASE